MKKIRIVSLLLLVCMAVLVLSSCSKTVVAMEYKGETVSFNMYSYWMSQIKSNYVTSANDTASYWSTKYDDGKTYEEKMREIVDFNVKVNLVCQKMFKDMGLKISDSKMKEIDTALADILEAYGSKSELNSFLANYNINYNMLREIYEAEQKASMVYEALYAKGGQREITAEQLDEYFKDNYTRVDMIMIYNSVVYETDEDGKIIYNEDTGVPKTRELTADEKKAKNQLAADIMTKLDNGEDFDALKKQYNEDPNKDSYNEGYYISINDISVYGSEIVLTVQDMEMGEHKKVETEAIVCIMKRKELTDKVYENENYENQLGNLKGYCQQDDFNSYMIDLTKDVVVMEDEIAKISVIDAALMS